MRTSNGQMMFFFFSTTLVWIMFSCQGEARVVGVPSPQCHPSVVSSMPPRIRKICEALETILEFSDSMETYLDEKEMEDEIDPQLVQAALAERRPMNSVGVKRKGEDVDHVFLRFGKRS